MESVYHIVRLAWVSVMQHRRLFWFALVASLVGVSGELLALNKYMQLSLRQPTELPFPFGFVDGVITLADWQGLYAVRPGLVIGFVLVAALLTLLFFWLVMVASGALYSATALALKGKQIALATHVRVGRNAARRIALTWGVGRLIIYTLVFVANVVYFSFWLLSLENNAMFLLGMAIVLTVAAGALVASFWSRFAQIIVIMEDVTAQKAMGKAWTMLRQNWLITLELSVLLLAIDLAALVGLVFLLSPFAIYLYTSIIIGAIDSFLWSAGIGAVVYFVLYVPLGMVLTALHTALWTALYNNIVATAPTAKSLSLRHWRVLRLIGKKPSVMSTKDSA